MKTERLVIGMAVGAVAALLLIPSTRKMILDGLGNLAGTIKDFAGQAEELSGTIAHAADGIPTLE